MLHDLAANATVPVINGLTKLSHPCQVLADVMTFEEKKGPIAGARWPGAAMPTMSAPRWIHAAARFGFTLRVASPPELRARPALRDWRAGEWRRCRLSADPDAAVQGADCVISDAWVSMGDERCHQAPQSLEPYQVNAGLMARAGKDAIFMHCLPAHRGEEVTDEVIDGPQSAVWDEAENRLHAQKAILAWCLG